MTIWRPGISVINVPILEMNRLKPREKGSGFFIAGKSDPCSMSLVSVQALIHCALSFRLTTNKVLSESGAVGAMETIKQDDGTGKGLG